MAWLGATNEKCCAEITRAACVQHMLGTSGADNDAAVLSIPSIEETALFGLEEEQFCRPGDEPDEADAMGSTADGQRAYVPCADGVTEGSKGSEVCVGQRGG